MNIAKITGLTFHHVHNYDGCSIAIVNDLLTAVGGFQGSNISPISSSVSPGKAMTRGGLKNFLPCQQNETLRPHCVQKQR